MCFHRVYSPVSGGARESFGLVAPLRILVFVSCRSYPLNSTIHRVYPLAAICWAASAQRRRNQTGYLPTFGHLLIVNKNSLTHAPLFFLSPFHPSFRFPSHPASFPLLPRPSPSPATVPLIVSPCLQVFALTLAPPPPCLYCSLSLSLLCLQSFFP